MGIITTRTWNRANTDPVAPRCRRCGGHPESGLLTDWVCSEGCPEGAAPEAAAEVVIDAVEPEGDAIRAKQARAEAPAEPLIGGDPLTPVKGRNAGKQWSPKPTPQR